MRVLTLDISTNAGYAVLESVQDGLPKLLAFGTITPRRELSDYLAEYGYPDAYVRMAWDMASQFMALRQTFAPDALIIEETNLGKNRYSQKTLEFLHCAFNRELKHPTPWPEKVIYLSSSAWRSALGLQMTKEDKKNNARLSKAKRNAAIFGTKLDKAALGVRGKVTKKHLAIRYVNAQYPSLNLKVKDNDIADAVCLGLAYFNNAVQCDGVVG